MHPRRAEDQDQTPRRSVLCNRRGRLAALFVVALVLRVAWCLFSHGQALPSDNPGNDDWQYDRIAVSLLAGHGFAFSEGRPTAYRVPVYPIFLAGVYAAIGHSYLAVHLLQAILGAASCLMLYALARRWTGERAALLSAAILAVYPTHLWLSGVVYSENLTTPLLLLTALAMTWAWRSRSWARWTLTGLIAATAALTHPIVAGLVVLLSVGTVAMHVVAERPRAWAPTAMGLVAALLIGTWVVRNGVVMGGFVLSSLGGNTLLGANNVITLKDPNYHGGWVNEWYIPGAWETIGRVDDELDRSRRMSSFGLAWLGEHPDLWPRLVWYKLARFYGPFLNERWSAEGLVYLGSYGLLSPFMAVGLWGIVRRGWGSHTLATKLMILTTLAYYTLVVIVFWGSPRFRLTIEPLLILAAAAALVRCPAWLTAAVSSLRPERRWQLQTQAV